MESNAQAKERCFDPQARHVDQATGFEYEDLAAWLLREPAKSERNKAIQQLRDQGYLPHVIKAFWQGFDAHEFDARIKGSGGGTLNDFHQRYTAGREAGEATRCWGPAAYKDKFAEALAKAFADKVDEIIYATLVGRSVPSTDASTVV